MSNLTFLFIFIPILSVVLLALNVLLAVHRPDEAKVSAYECGFQPVYGQTRTTFQIHFMVVALLFLIFDLEVLLLYPLAVTLYQVSAFGFATAMIFFIILTIGFVLEIGSGAISLSNLDSIKNKNNANPSSLFNSYLYPGTSSWNNRAKTKKRIISGLGGNNNNYNYSSHTKNFSTLTKPLTYWELIHEKDSEQETNNPHILARRHLTKGIPTDAEIINLVLQQILENKINQEELEKLISIVPLSILFENIKFLIHDTNNLVLTSSLFNRKIRKIISEHIGVKTPTRGKGSTKIKIAGVYVWTNLKTGDQNVGSSTDLYTRLRYYFKPSVLNESNRLINKNMKEFGIENFKLSIYIIDTAGINKSKIRDLTLSLEQYYIFTLKPSLNLIKVVGSNPIVNFSEEHIASIKKANSKPVFVYKDNILIFEASSATDLVKETNISQSTVSLSLKNPSKKVFNYFNISHEGPTPYNVIEKIDAQALKNLFKEQLPKFMEKGFKPIPILMISENGEIVKFPSTNACRKHFKIRYSTIYSNINTPFPLTGGKEPININGTKWVIYVDNKNK